MSSLGATVTEHLDRQEQCGWHHDWPEALAALRGVLKLHAPAREPLGFTAVNTHYCVECRQAYPCLTIRRLASDLEVTRPEGGDPA